MSEEENRTRKLLQMRSDEDGGRKEEKKKKAKKEVLEWVKAIVFALVIAFLIHTFLFTMIRVDGESMMDTLRNGDRLYVSELTMKLSGGPARGDVVICHYPGREGTNIIERINGGTNFVKRVIGLAGDTVEIKNGVTYLNGEALHEDYITRPSRKDFGPYTVPEGKIFVMGDNRASSNDSRYVGALDEDMIVGVVRYRWWPLNNMGVIENHAG